MKIFTSILMCSCILYGCAQQSKTIEKKQEKMMTKQEQDLADKIEQREFGEYFLYPIHHETLELIWSTNSEVKIYQNIFSNKNASLLARLISAEVLYFADLQYFEALDRKDLAFIYVTAFSEDLTGMAETWGIPFEKSQYGILGDHLISIGPDVLPLLIPHLKDETRRDNYVQGELGAMAETYHLRVKDFASFFIHRIQGNIYNFNSNPRSRDEKILDLLASLEEE